MITREQYNQALDIVEQYHKQLKAEHEATVNMQKTPFYRWLQENRTKIPTRILNALIFIGADEYDDFYLEDVTHYHFMRWKNLGEKSWKQFVELRGY